MLPVITIDGPAGVGKSTLARKLAAALNMAYLDTGAMYRFLGLQLGAQAADMPEAELQARCRAFCFSLQPEGLACNGQLVGPAIRTEKAGRLASVVAQLPALRLILQEAQRNLAAHTPLVVEGRDMGTKVFPQAACKFFLTATPEVRAQRRFAELTESGKTYEDILQDIITRDARDQARTVDPLRPAPDAHLVDTSALDIDGVLAVLLAQTPKLFPATPPAEPAFSHLDASGAIHMVDVGHKQPTHRIAKAAGTVHMSAQTLALLQRNALPKGDVLTTAKVAGILAAKRTAEFIPLCHPLGLDYADVVFTIQDQPPCVHIFSEARTSGRTGVEMEALLAVQIAAATIYDMAKAVQKDMVISNIRLLYKSGGKSGTYERMDDAVPQIS